MSDATAEYTDRQLGNLEKKLTREYKQAAKEVSEKLETYLKKFEEKDVKKQEQLKAGKITEQEYMNWRYGQMMTGKRWKAMQETLTQDLVNVDKTAAQMMNDTLPQVYAENSNYGTYIAETGANIDTSWTLYSKDTVRALVESDEISLPAASVNIPKDKKWIAKNVNSAVLQGVLQGESIDKIAKRLYNVTDMNRKASVRNARTLVTSAENQGRTDSFKRAEDMGIKMEQGWLATLDNRTRHSHRQMDGEWIKIGAKFSNGLRYPADPSGRPEEVYNCRCTLIGRVNGVEIDLTDISQRNTTHMQGMSYEEWKNAKAASKRTGESVKDYEARTSVKALNSADIMFKGSTSNKNAGTGVKAVLESVSRLPKSLNNLMQETTFVLGQNGSACDFLKKTVYVSKSATKYEIDHEIGHLIEHWKMDKADVDSYKAYLFENVTREDAYFEKYFTSSGEERTIILIKSKNLLTEYQGRTYAKSIKEAFDKNGNIKGEYMCETISEAFALYQNNQQAISSDNPVRKIIEDAMK